MLFGNTLRWDVDYLARQLPVLPARRRLPAKVKPLVRLTERETAAWCIVRGIDYQVEECPMAAGNKHLGYKAALNALEARSPGTKAAFYLGFLERMAPLLAGRSRAAVDGLAAVRRLRRADDRRGRARSAGSSRRRRRTSRCRSRLLSTSGAVGAGERAASRRRAGAAARRQAAALPRHARRRRRVPQPRRLRAPRRRSSASRRAPSCARRKGAEYTVLRPTLEDFVLEMPRGAQVIYPKDLAPICMLADIGPGRAGVRDRRRVGRAVDDDAALAAPTIVGYELREDFANRARSQRARASSARTALERYRRRAARQLRGHRRRDGPFDRVVLDLPEPWQVVPHAEARAARRAASSSPTRRRSPRRRRPARRCKGKWIDARTLEVLHRGWHIEGQAVRPDHRMVAHTGFLTVARFLGRLTGRRRSRIAAASRSRRSRQMRGSRLDEDALPGALLGGLDDRVELAVGDVGHALGTLRVALGRRRRSCRLP